MNNKLEGTVELTFIRGGIAKSGNAYLQVSNGRKELFVDVKQLRIDEDTFKGYNTDDVIGLEVQCVPGNEDVSVLSIIE